MVDYEKLLDFWKLIRPTRKNEFVEIRVTDKDKPQRYYQLVNKFQKENSDIIIHNGSQFFIQKFNQLTRILSYDDYFILKNFKICYGLTLRVSAKDGSVGGSYDYVKNIRFVFFDVDKEDHSNILDHERKLIDMRINYITEYLTKYGLEFPTIVDSGAGRHIIYKINKQNITDGKRIWYRDFVKEISDLFTHGLFGVDAVYDFTRVFGLPETLNVKRGRKVQALQISHHENDFKIAWKRKSKKKGGKVAKVNLPKLENSLEWKIFTHPNLPTGDIHNVVLFAVRLLIKELELDNWDELADIANAVRGSPHDLDPNKVGDKEYNFGIIANWCKKHQDWCLKNNIHWINYAPKEEQIDPEIPRVTYD